MKKTIFVLFAVLLVLLMAGCDLLTPSLDTEEDDLPLYTEDGRAMVHLSIGVGNDGTSRALTENLAKAGVNYYEVAFLDPAAGGTDIYRAAWDYSKTGRIAVPAGNYSSAANAVLFAGRYNDKTLLAVGTIDRVTDSNGSTAPSSTNIIPTTKSVTFILSPLLNDINTASITTGTSSASSFQITGPTAAGPAVNHNYKTSALTSGLPMLPDTSIPIFAVPPYDYVYAGTPNPATPEVDQVLAEWTVTCGTNTGTTPANYAKYTGVVLAADGKVNSTAYLSDLPESQPVKVNVEITDPIYAAAGTAIPSTGIIKLKFDYSTTKRPNSNGLSMISLDIPVYAIGKDNNITDPITWHIRGGLNQMVLDEGSKKNSLGGAILIGVGPVKGKDIEIIPEW